MIEKAVGTAFYRKRLAIPLWGKAWWLFKKAFCYVLHLFIFCPFKGGANNLSAHNNLLCTAGKPIIKSAFCLSATNIQNFTSLLFFLLLILLPYD